MSEEVLNLGGMSSSSRRDITRFKVTEGSHIFRILPPFGTNHNNVPSREVKLHWGFKKKDGKPSPVTCSYPTEGYCPICDNVRSIEQQAEAQKAEGNEDGYQELIKQAGEFKVRRSFLLNAANKAGEVGMLEVTKTSIDKLIELFKQYQNKYGKNPTSLTQGVWFVFSRTGKGFKTTYSVEFNKNVITLDDGDQVEKLDNSALAANIVNNYDKLGYDIHKMYAPVSAADLTKILNGAAIDEVIVRQPPPAEETSQKAETKPVAAVAPKATVKTEAKAEAKATPAPAKATPKPAQTELLSDDEDILAMLND